MHFAEPINEEEDDFKSPDGSHMTSGRSKAGSPEISSKKSDQDIKRSIKSKIN
jgi:hypothetical protein